MILMVGIREGKKITCKKGKFNTPSILITDRQNNNDFDDDDDITAKI